jgi:epoxide hydrolase-like predicted phosphatase
MTPKAIIFDFFGVFVPDSGHEMALESPDPEAIMALFREYDLGHATHPELAAKIHELNGMSISDIMIAMEPRDRPDEQLVRVVQRLRPQYKIGLLTNAVRSELNFCITNDEMAEWFDDVVISQEVELAKPDAPIYIRACERLGVNPGEVVFIDDRERNLKGAIEVGMQTMLFCGVDDLLDRLAEAGLEINDA